MRDLFRWTWISLIGVVLLTACSVTPEMAASDAFEAAAPTVLDDVSNADTALLPGPEDDSIMARSAEVDERITAQGLEAAFATTMDQPLLRVLEVATVALPDRDLYAHARHAVSEDVGGEGVSILVQGPVDAIDAVRRLPDAVGPTLEDVQISADLTQERYHLVDGQFWRQETWSGSGWRVRPVDAPPASDEAFSVQAATNAFYYLSSLEQAVIGEPVFTSVFPDGTRRASVSFDGGALGPLTLGGQVLLGDGNDLLAELADFEDPLQGFIEISTDGRVTFAQVDVSAWQRAFLKSFGDVDEEDFDLDELAASYTMAFAAVNGDLAVEAPCAQTAASCIVDTAESSDDVAANPDDEITFTDPVLIATQTIPRGTSMSDILENPGRYLVQRTTDSTLILADAIRTIAELELIEPDLVLIGDVLPGEQLLRDRFGASIEVEIDCPFDFVVDSVGNEQVLIPVQEIPAGTSVRELIAAPTVYLSARVVSADDVCLTSIVSISGLADRDGMVTKDAVPPGVILDARHFFDPSDFSTD